MDPGFVNHNPFPEQGNPAGAEGLNDRKYTIASKARPSQYSMNEMRKQGGWTTETLKEIDSDEKQRSRSSWGSCCRNIATVAILGGLDLSVGITQEWT
jgi:hypothetical protein